MDRTAEAAADRQRNNRPYERQTYREVKAEFVDTEPPPRSIRQPDLLADAVGCWLWFSVSDCDDAERNQHNPDPRHQYGVVAPVNWDRSSEKIEINLRRNMRLIHAQHRSNIRIHSSVGLDLGQFAARRPRLAILSETDPGQAVVE